jgi:hypothetical protein
MVSKTSSDISSKLFMGYLNSEINALENLKILAEALSIDKRRVKLYEPLFGCQA